MNTPKTKACHVLKGGAWYWGVTGYCRVAYNYTVLFGCRDKDQGLRCIAPLSKGKELVRIA